MFVRVPITNGDGLVAPAVLSEEQLVLRPSSSAGFQLAVQPSMETLISLQTVIYIYYPAKEARST